MKAFKSLRRKSISEPEGRKNKVERGTPPLPSPSPLPSGNNGTTNRNANGTSTSRNGEKMQGGISGFQTLPRGFTASPTSNPNSSDFDPNANHLRNQKRSSSSNSTTTALPQVSLNRFSGSPLANFSSNDLVSESFNDLPNNSNNGASNSMNGYPKPNSQSNSKSEIQSLREAEAEPTTPDVTPSNSTAILNESFQTPMSESAPSLKGSPLQSSVPLESTSSTSNHQVSPTEPASQSFDPSSHPSRGRPDSLGPSSYFGGIGAPAPAPPKSQSHHGSQFSELESPMLSAVPIKGLGMGETSKREESGRKEGRSRSRDKKKERVRDEEVGKIVDGKVKGKEKEKEKEGGTLKSKSSMRSLRKLGGKDEKRSHGQVGQENGSQALQGTPSPSQPPLRSQYQYQSPPPSQPIPANQLSSKKSKEKEKEKEKERERSKSQPQPQTSAPEMKSSGSGFFSLMRRNTKRKGSLVDEAPNGSTSSNQINATASKSKSLQSSSSAPSLSKSSKNSANSPNLPSNKPTNYASASPRTKEKDLSKEKKGSRPSSSNSRPSSSPQNPQTSSSRHQQSHLNRQPPPETPFNSQDSPPQSNSLESNGSSNEILTPRFGSGRSGSRTGSSQGEGNGPMTPIDGTPLIGLGTSTFGTGLNVNGESNGSNLKGKGLTPLITSAQEINVQAREPPNENVGNRPKRQADVLEVRNSIAQSLDDEDAKKEVEERDGERPSSRFDLVIDAADRESLDVNRKETQLIEENGNEEVEKALRSLPMITSNSPNGLQSSGTQPQSSLQNGINSSPVINGNSASSWSNYNPSSTLPSSFRSSTTHYRTVQEIQTTMIPSKIRDSSNPKGYTISWKESKKSVLVTYCDLFEMVWTRTSPQLLTRLISFVDCAEIKTLRHTSNGLRFALDNQVGREIVLRRFLGPLGYRTWGNGKNGQMGKDPLPISLQDLDAFIIGADLTPEYHLVGAQYSSAPQSMDSRIPRLARASTRSYNRVLSRLRLQPVFKIPSSSQPSTPKQRSPANSPSMSSVNGFRNSQQNMPQSSSGLGRVNSYYPQQNGSQTQLNEGALMAGSSLGVGGLSPHQSPILPINRLSHRNSSQTISPARSPASTPGISGAASPISLTPSHSPSGGMLHSLPEETSHLPALPPMPSPWKPGRAALFRCWVPAREEIWLSDEELGRCEQELFRAGIWNYLIKGDVVWDCAIGNLTQGSNIGKLLFDGRYLRDLSYVYAPGHLPSWLNSFLYSPSYFHNVIHSHDNPVVFLDILPWREQILGSLRLVQDHVETNSPQGRYRVAKWLYRSFFNITGGQIISDEGVESVDEGWHGRVIVECEGTAEHAKSLIARCAGPTASAQSRAAILAAVTNGFTAQSLANLPKHSSTYDQNGDRVETTSPWQIIRERSRPGLIWIKPMEGSDRLR